MCVDHLPTVCRNNLLGTLQRDSTCIGLYDIQPTMVGNDEVEPSFLERAVLPGVTGVAGGMQPSAAGAITSFSWHPTHENRLLNISLSGKFVLMQLHDLCVTFLSNVCEEKRY